MLPPVLRLLERAGIPPFTSPFDANLVAVRDPSAPLDTFDGRVHLVYVDTAGVWHDVSARAATRPGSAYLKAPMNPKGTFVLAAGVRNAGSHALGYHKGDLTRPAFAQVGKVSGRRDGDRDLVLDPGEALFDDGAGVNVHDCDAPAYLAGCIGVPKAELGVLLSEFKALQARRPQRTVSLAVVER